MLYLSHQVIARLLYGFQYPEHTGVKRKRDTAAVESEENNKSADADQSLKDSGSRSSSSNASSSSDDSQSEDSGKRTRVSE